MFFTSRHGSEIVDEFSQEASGESLGLGSRATSFIIFIIITALLVLGSSGLLFDGGLGSTRAWTDVVVRGTSLFVDEGGDLTTGTTF